MSYLFSLYQEKRTGLIFETKELIETIPYQLLLTLPVQTEYKWEKSLKTFLDSISYKKDNKKIAFITAGLKFQETQDKFKKQISKLMKPDDFIITENLNEIQNYENKFLIIFSGSTTRTKIRLMNEELALQKIPPRGWIYFDPYIQENQVV